jgi:hypothetical protein
MNAGTIFVLLLAAGFLAFIVYLAILSRRSTKIDDENEKSKGGRPS